MFSGEISAMNCGSQSIFCSCYSHYAEHLHNTCSTLTVCTVHIVLKLRKKWLFPSVAPSLITVLQHKVTKTDKVPAENKAVELQNLLRGFQEVPSKMKSTCISLYFNLHSIIPPKQHKKEEKI